MPVMIELQIEKRHFISSLTSNIDIFSILILIISHFEVACGEFIGQSPCKDQYICESSETVDPSSKIEDRSKILQEPLEEGSTIIYVPTRKETLSITKYLCGFGVKAAAYNASVCITWLFPWSIGWIPCSLF